MGGIPGRLGALGVLDDVLHGVPVETEFVGEGVEAATVGIAQVHPDQSAGLAQMLGDVGEGKVLRLERAVDPQPGPDPVAAGSGHGQS